MNACIFCSKIIGRNSNKYCSNKCQKDWEYQNYIKNWKAGKASITKNISKHIKRYLLESWGEKCEMCEWEKKHPITGVTPLEVDHIDGNAHNNRESNLRLICPNCHSLTSNFRNLNKGKGRNWRTK